MVKRKRIQETYGFDPNETDVPIPVQTGEVTYALNAAARPPGWRIGSTLEGWSKFVEDKRILSLPENIDDLIGMDEP